MAFTFASPTVWMLLIGWDSHTPPQCCLEFPRGEWLGSEPIRDLKQWDIRSKKHAAGQNGKPRQEVSRSCSFLTDRKRPLQRYIVTIFLYNVVQDATIYVAYVMVIEMCSPRMFSLLVFLFFSFQSADYPFLMHHCHQRFSLPLPFLFFFFFSYPTSLFVWQSDMWPTSIFSSWISVPAQRKSGRICTTTV